MSEKRLYVRMAATGGKELKGELQAIGRAGQEAMRELSSAAQPANDQLQRVSGSAGGAVASLEALSARSAALAASLRAAGASTGTLVERIDAVTGVSRNVARSADDVMAYGQAMDDVRAKVNPAFGVIRSYKAAVLELRDAHRVGAISADEMAAAISRERQAALQSLAVIKGRAQALQQVSTGANVAAVRMQQMFFQVNDIGVSLAGGMNPLVVLAQQGTQIAQIYGFGNGGASAAMRDFGRLLLGPIQRFPLMSAAIGISAAALGGLTYEINQTTDVAVGLGDTFLAVLEVVGRGIADVLQPAVQAILPIVQAVWDAIVTVVKTSGNVIINGNRIVIDGVRTAVSTIPDIFLGAFSLAASHVLTKMHDIVWYVGQSIDAVAGLMNTTFGTDFGTGSLEGVVGTLSEASGQTFRAAEAAAGRIADAWSGFKDRSAETMASDPMGDFFNAVREEAINNALDRMKEEGGGAGKALEETAKGWAAVIEKVREYANESMDIGPAVGDALVGAFTRAEDAFAQFAITGKFNFSDLITSMLSDLAKLAARRFILGPLAGALGEAFSGLAPGFGDMLIGYSQGAQSYDGGGYTGNGARSGGLDGKGGFMAMLHPRETVVDHHKGQSMGGGTVVQIIDQRKGGEPVQAERRRGPSGEEQVVLVVRDAMSRGEFDGAQRSRYASQPRALRR